MKTAASSMLSGATNPLYYGGSRERAVHAKNRILMPNTYCIKESKWKGGSRSLMSPSGRQAYVKRYMLSMKLSKNRLHFYIPDVPIHINHPFIITLHAFNVRIHRNKNLWFLKSPRTSIHGGTPERLLPVDFLIGRDMQAVYGYFSTITKRIISWAILNFMFPLVIYLFFITILLFQQVF